MLRRSFCTSIVNKNQQHHYHAAGPHAPVDVEQLQASVIFRISICNIVTTYLNSRRCPHAELFVDAFLAAITSDRYY
jgi:hypothetical protein